jgi:hypothetical protein
LDANQNKNHESYLIFFRLIFHHPSRSRQTIRSANPTEIVHSRKKLLSYISRKTICQKDNLLKGNLPADILLKDDELKCSNTF